MPKRPAARVFFLVATEARTAVVFRKGPKRHVQLWLKGSVDTAASNLSPDGQLLVYCATKGGKRFTAVSRPPYFTALAFWPDGWPPTNGGFFLDNRGGTASFDPVRHCRGGSMNGPAVANPTRSMLERHSSVNGARRLGGPTGCCARQATKRLKGSDGWLDVSGTNVDRRAERQHLLGGHCACAAADLAYLEASAAASLNHFGSWRSNVSTRRSLVIGLARKSFMPASRQF